MYLDLASAVSPGGLLGHAAYLLLVLSMMMRVMVWLRILVILSSIVGIAYFGLVLRDPVSVFWETLLIMVNIVQLSITGWRNWQARFSEVEAGFMERCFPGLPAGQMRSLLDAGVWRQLDAGAYLSRQGDAVSHLSYISEGVARIEVGGQIIGQVGAGHFIGEMTVETGEPASATIIADVPLTVWQISANDLRDLMQRREDVARALQASFFRDLRVKLITQNTTLSRPDAPAA